MKTAISIADEVYAEAERLARRVKKLRSRLYTEAVAEYVARHDPEAVTAAMNRVCEPLDTRPDLPCPPVPSASCGVRNGGGDVVTAVAVQWRWIGVMLAVVANLPDPVAWFPPIDDSE